eukprot:3018083-Prymnesium_polylepis.1
MGSFQLLSSLAQTPLWSLAEEVATSCLGTPRHVLSSYLWVLAVVTRHQLTTGTYPAHVQETMASTCWLGCEAAWR